jgi:putative addiction module killer protein
MHVEEYVRPDLSNPYRRWFDSLNAQAAAKVAVAKFRLSQGNTSRVKWFDGIGEYRIDWGPGYRIYLARDGADLIILYGGGTKRRQKQDIEAAKLLHGEYQARKAAEKATAKKVVGTKAQRPTKQRRKKR